MKKKLLLLLLLLNSYPLLFASKISKDTVVQVKTSVDNISSIVGKEIDYEITILSRDGIIYDFKNISFDNSKDISRILEAKTNTSKEAKLNKKVIKYKIAFYDIGQFVISPYELSYSYLGKNHIIEGEDLSIVVHPFSNGDTLPNTRTTFSLPIPLYVWIIIPLFIALILLIIFLVKLIRHRIKNKQRLQNTAEDILALKALTALDKKDYISKSEYSLYYFELTRILKVYISKRFLIDITGMTTIEIKENLSSDNDITSKDNIFNFFDYADKIKFTKFIPDDNSIKTHKEFVLNYIKNNRNREIVLKELQKK